MATARIKTTVDVEPREDRGKNACRRLRRAGLLPGSLYGLEREPVAVSVSPKRIEEIVHSESGRNTILTLALHGGETKQEVLLRELQRDPVNERLLHVDFLRIDPTKELQLKIPIRLEGLATGVKNEGGILDFVHREVEVLCLPDRIPEHIDVDISELHLGQHVAVKDLTVGDGVQILDDPEAILAVVAAPKVSLEPTAAEEGEEAEAAVAEADKDKEAEGEKSE